MKQLSLTDSSVLKGIAILIMLCHHVFEPGQYGSFTDYWVSGKPVLGIFALQCKLCVAIFVFVSGYGLMVKYGSEEHLHIKSFYWQRFVKLMMNYWFVWLIFVPLSVFWLSDKPFGWWYFVNHKWAMGVLDFLGLTAFSNHNYPYNPTWWFYSCIIGLYLLFPALRWLMRRSMLFAVVFSVVLFFPPGLIGVVRQYLPTFVCGMAYAVMAQGMGKNVIPPPRGSLVWTLACAVLLAAVFVERIWVHNPILFDALIVTFMVYAYQQITGLVVVRRVLAFFGKYSMDMFLTHTFIFSLWPATHNIVYATKNPLVIYLTLVAMSLTLAILLGWVKKVTGYNRLIKVLRAKIQ